ncbi:methyltransferase domain-containing protein [Aequorivita sp. SDUM287046]|uniref:Methyltransferase domain-containing protein n=1 Tax=Aequorivita aurantiaca TaxID=3053356 RepID=A0ABT8DK18_9FLAO|nr:methyltransferase domain-containing protein [Aequorivita aurantiaca]MDN3725277.1 methyltransferase domain-containing protein [Aequorivita aurantiaca]
MLTLIKKYFKKAKKRIVKKKHKNDSISTGPNTCSVCNQNVRFKNLPYEYFLKFYENGFVFSPFLFETLNIKDYSCSNCGASDRDRLMMLYMKKYLIDKKSVRLIDFAPAKALGNALKNQSSIEYRSADLYMESVDDKIDIRDMHVYPDESFDFFICSHILEHVDEDAKALDELYRITAKNGGGILLVPILLGLEKSVENKEYLKSEHLRWKYFGQDDHVRMYSKSDFLERIENSGFKIEQISETYFDAGLFEQCGLDKKSTLYIVEK